MSGVMYLVSLVVFFFTKRKQVLQFTQIFAALQNSGLPVLRSLRLIQADTKSRVLNCTLGAVIRDVESGSTLSEAFTQHPRVFDRLFVSMIRAGEAGGALEIILARLAQYLEKPSKGEAALILRTLGTMVASGVPILEAISIVRGLCTTHRSSMLWENVYKSIREGDTIAQPMRECGFIPSTIVGLVDVGEETGDLDTMLLNAAMLYEQGLVK